MLPHLRTGRTHRLPGLDAALLRAGRVLPATARTPGGYRSYDERAVERLKFIARAKQLDLPLDEIRDLAAVWDAGSCASVQQRLTDLLTAEIADVDIRVADLTAFRAQLVATRDGLGQHTPPGPCGDDCGCLRPTVAATRQSVRLLTSRPSALLPIELDATGGQPVACTLTGSDQRTRIHEWGALLAAVTRRDNVDGGMRLTLPADADLIAQTARLAALEHGCCRFFDFTIDLTADTAVLTVRAPADARDLLDAVFGAHRLGARSAAPSVWPWRRAWPARSVASSNWVWSAAGRAHHRRRVQRVCPPRPAVHPRGGRRRRRGRTPPAKQSRCPCRIWGMSKSGSASCGMTQ